MARLKLTHTKARLYDVIPTVGRMRRQAWTNPLLADADYILNDSAQPASGTTTVTTFLNQPDHPRNVTVVGTQATATGNLVVNGTNIRGEAITETLAINGTTPVVGNKAFKTITSIVVPTRGAASDAVDVGIGAKLGLDQKMSEKSVVATYVDGTLEATAATVANSATAVESNTIITNTAMDGSKDVACVFYTTDTSTASGSTT